MDSLLPTFNNQAVKEKIFDVQLFDIYLWVNRNKMNWFIWSGCLLLYNKENGNNHQHTWGASNDFCTGLGCIKIEKYTLQSIGQQLNLFTFLFAKFVNINLSPAQKKILDTRYLYKGRKLYKYMSKSKKGTFCLLTL